jgi:hypothetical protein
LDDVQSKLEHAEARLNEKQGELDHWKAIIPSLQKAKDVCPCFAAVYIDVNYVTLTL